MAWQVRGRRRYYTRTLRVQGGYARQYVGGGVAGEAAAAADALRRANRRAAIEARRAAEARLEEVDRPLLGLHRLCGLLVHAALTRKGYHKHGGEWRKAMTTTTRGGAAPDGGSAAAGPGAGPPINEDAAQLVLRAARLGDHTVLPLLTRLLDERPQLWREVGDLAAQAREAWIGLAAGRDLLAQESMRRKAAELRSELAGPDAPPLERLLADRVVACWLQVHYSDAVYTQRKDASFAQDAAAQKRQNAAQTRYMQAVRQLAGVRKLLRPVPSAMDLLTFPVDEVGAGARGGRRRAGLAAEPVVN